MANMGYCRFENTLSDLEDCFAALDENGIDNLSPSERKAALKLIVVCGDLSDAHHRILTEDATQEEALEAGA